MLPGKLAPPNARPWALVVVPEVHLRGALAHGLSSAGVAAVQASNGVEALFALQTPTLPALVILDWDAPLLSGERLFVLLRQDPFTQNVPVMVLSHAPLSANWFANHHHAAPEGFVHRPLTSGDVVAATLHLLVAQQLMQHTGQPIETAAELRIGPS